MSCKGFRIKGDSQISTQKPKSLPKLRRVSKIIPKINIIHTHTNFTNDDLDVPPEEIRTQKLELSRNEDYLLEKIAKEFEEQASRMDTKQRISLDVSQSNENCLNFYLSQKKSDGLGRVPYNMIGIAPHNTENPITSFVEKQKIAPMRATKGKDRFKNMSFFGSTKAEGLKNIELVSKHIDKISQVYDNRFKAANKAKKDSDNIAQLNEFMKS